MTGNHSLEYAQRGYFSEGPVVQTSSSNGGVVGLTPGWGVKITHVSWPKKSKHKNRNNIVTGSMKTLKIVHIKKKRRKKENSQRGKQIRRASPYKPWEASNLHWLGSVSRWM